MGSMKRTIFLLCLVLAGFVATAQRTVHLRHLWERPQVHVLFQGYHLSFLIKDIDKALGFLAEMGDTTYGIKCGLDTARNYPLELFPGLRQLYKSPLQAMMQNGVGAYLLTTGHVLVKNKKGKVLKSVIADFQPQVDGERMMYLVFYDPKHKRNRPKQVVFTGQMAAGLYNRDLGIFD